MLSRYVVRNPVNRNENPITIQYNYASLYMSSSVGTPTYRYAERIKVDIALYLVHPSPAVIFSRD